MKFKLKLPYDPAVALQSTYPKEMKSVSQRAFCTPMFTATSFTIAQIGKKLKYLSTDEWTKKMCVCVYLTAYMCVCTYTHATKYNSPMRKKGTLLLATTWNEPGGHYDK